jgi:nucleoid-associated protein YgaU
VKEVDLAMRPMTTLLPRAAALAAGAASIAVPLAASVAAAQQVAPEAPTVPGAAPALPGAAAASPAGGKARSSLAVSSSRRTIRLGDRALVTGRLRSTAGRLPVRRVQLQVRADGRWATVARDVTNRTGRFRLRYTPRRPASLVLRVAYPGDGATTATARRISRVNVFRRALASWYGPGLYGGSLACGGTLSPGTLGVAHKQLPCGTKVTFHHRGRTVRVPVVDRGPFVGAREYDLTAATKARLRFGGTGTVLATK